MNELHDLIDSTEDKLFQTIIDRQEGALGMAEQELCGEKPLYNWPPSHQNSVLSCAPSCGFRRRWLSRAVVAAIIVFALAITAFAAAPTVLNWLETAHGNFVHISADESATEKIAAWTQVYVPDYVPEDYLPSDASRTEGMTVIEYVNTKGDRLIFYQYSPSSNIRIDTEFSEETVLTWKNGETAYLSSKGSTSIVYWSSSDWMFSIEYNPEDLTIDEIELMEESIQWQE